MRYFMVCHYISSFARQKIDEVVHLKQLANNEQTPEILLVLNANIAAAENRRTSSLIHAPAVKERVAAVTEKDENRESPFSSRKIAQREALNLSLFPTTTIGSFPQTPEVRGWRAKFKKGDLTLAQYDEFNDIIQNIADMDAAVITIECSRSQMELLDAFADFNYPNEIGPGVYNIHSPYVFLLNRRW